MRDDTSEKLLNGLDCVVRNATPFTTVEGMLDWAHEFSGRVHRKLANVRTREQIKEMLAAEPEPSQKALALCDAAFRFAPYLVNRLLKWTAERTVKGLQSNPSGPRVAALVGEREQICAFIGGLLAKRVSLPDAQKRAAQKWTTSKRNVVGIWNERGLHDIEPLSIDEAELKLLELFREGPDTNEVRET